MSGVCGHFLCGDLNLLPNIIFKSMKKRRYSVFMKGDEVKLVLYLLYTITLIKPLYDATRGFLKIPDPAWFLQPVMCWITTLMYSYATIKRRLSL